MNYRDSNREIWKVRRFQNGDCGSSSQENVLKHTRIETDDIDNTEEREYKKPSDSGC